MGEINNVMNEYLGNACRFADFFNGVMFCGDNVVKPEYLRDASEKYNQSVAYNPRTKKRGDTVERIRDLKKIYNDSACFRILGLEGQDYIDYGCGVRGAEYDIMEYRKQMKRLKAGIDNNKEKTKNLTKSELFSGMRKCDRLYPTYTVWFYYGTESYDGPRALSDMVDFPKDDEFRQHFSDYKINVVCLNEIEDMNVFQTELRPLLKLMKHRDSWKRMQEVLKDDPDYIDLHEDTLYAMSVVTDRPKIWEEREKYIKEGEVSYNMCLALDQMEAEARKEGREEGENLLASLIKKLSSLGKIDEIVNIADDVELRERLYIEYGLKKTV